MTQIRDRKGRELHPGDLIRTPHFIGPRREQFWLYHVVVMDQKLGRLRMVPAQYLEPMIKRSGGDCLIDEEHAANCEIISGDGPGDILDFRDRPRVKGRRAGSDGEGTSDGKSD